jgi:poly(glycerol-phosphate) alpha-glucosyltransferase
MDVDVDLIAGEASEKRAEEMSVWEGQVVLSNFKNMKGIIKRLFVGDGIFHVHGLWGKHAIIGYLCSNIMKKKVVISPHGMMDSWALNNSSVKKFLARKLYEERFWSKASCFHALNDNEASEIRKCVPGANVVIIPNGVDVPEFDRHEVNKVRRLLFLGRLDRKKGIYELLDAWEKWSINNGNIELHVAGSGDEELEEKLKRLDDVGVVKYHGEVYGGEKDLLFKTCDAFILPSFSEGLPMTVLEAMSYGMATFISSNCNMAYEIDKNIAFEVQPNLESLLNAFQYLLDLSDASLVKQASFAKEHVSQNYSWKSVADKHVQNYRGLIRGCD